MESAPLTAAHDHVRSAATATFAHSIATAGHEHDTAALRFHDAARDTSNPEALRILTLLEDHHRKLAGLIKEAPRKTPAAANKPDTASTTPTPAAPTTATSPTTTSPSQPSSPPASRRRLPQPSIASNLAEKRGIPSARRTTTRSPVTVAGAITQRSDHATPVRDLLERHSRKPEPASSTESPKPRRDPAPPPDDNFRRFYTAFGGVISAISAPLAFTSLPLNPTPPTPAPAPEPPRTAKASSSKSRPQSRNASPDASRTVKSSVPDLAALISKPALRALRGDGTTLNPNESFYLVPTSGGTVTYASILQNPNSASHPSADGSQTLKGGSSHEHDEFVDARETVGPPSPTTSRRPTHSRRASNADTTNAPASTVTNQRSIAAGRGTGLKTLEELALENTTLKALVDKQSKRLQMWETNSQNQFSALAQSFRARGAVVPSGFPSPPLPQHPPHLDTDPNNNNSSNSNRDTDAKLAALQAQLADLESANAALARQNERNATVIARYREQWEKLKAGARKKETERRERDKDRTRNRPKDAQGEGEAEGDESEGPQGGVEGEGNGGGGGV